MSSPTKVNEQAVDALKVIREAVLAAEVVQSAGAGKAYQSVAQSSAIAIQDAADSLRNLGAISATAIGVAMTQYVATGDPKYAKAVRKAQKVVTQATKDFRRVGRTASHILNCFPTGGHGHSHHHGGHDHSERHES
ncbi:MAG: hypothetical protein AAF533_05830 [Acidobacteriota bacterium]